MNLYHIIHSLLNQTFKRYAVFYQHIMVINIGSGVTERYLWKIAVSVSLMLIM